MSLPDEFLYNYPTALLTATLQIVLVYDNNHLALACKLVRLSSNSTKIDLRLLN
jgi:hypothetical protein